MTALSNPNLPPDAVRLLDATVLQPVDQAAKLRREAVLEILGRAYWAALDDFARMAALKEVAELFGIGFEEFYEALRNAKPATH